MTHPALICAEIRYAEQDIYWAREELAYIIENRHRLVGHTHSSKAAILQRFLDVRYRIGLIEVRLAQLVAERVTS